MFKAKNQNFFLLFFALGLLIAFFSFQSSKSPTQSISPTPTISPTPIPKTVTVIINLKDRKLTSSINDLSATDSAFTLLQGVSARQNLNLKYKVYPFGTLVESIDNLKNTSAKAWIFFVNDQSANVGADSYLVKPGDVIEWKYLKPEF